jgi:hypothetical protein
MSEYVIVYNEQLNLYQVIVAETEFVLRGFHHRDDAATFIENLYSYDD